MKIEVYMSHLRKVCLLALFALLGTGLYAADQAPASGAQTVTVSGVVKDPSGALVVGATVIEKGTTNATITNSKGAFTLTIKPNATLMVEHLSYKKVEIPAGNRTTIDITVENATEMIEELVVIGYGTQKKTSLTGAVSAIQGDEVVTTKNENVQNMLTGKVPGLRIVQNNAEPGRFSNSMDIRGFGSPLVVIDGVPRDASFMARLDAEDIESISVVKDASASVYGVNSSRGLVLITTKKGGKDNTYINYSGNYGWQMPSNFPDLCDAVEWMTLANEIKRHNVDDPTATVTYKDNTIEEYRNGTKTAPNWKDEVFRKCAPQTQHTISASGGNDAVSYFASLGYNHQGSFLQTDAINYEKYTLRSNVTANINRNLKFELNLSGLLDTRNSSVYSAEDIVRGMWLMQSIDQVWYDEGEHKYMQPSNGGLVNPVAMMDTELTGHNWYKSKTFQSGASLTYNVPFIQGLSVKGFYSYDYILNDNKEFMQGFNLYAASNGAAILKNFQSGTNAPYKVSRYFYSKDHSLWNTQMNYKRTFAQQHNVSAMVLFENTHKQGDNFRGSREVLLPVEEVFAGTDKQTFTQDAGASALYDYAFHAWVGRVNYDFRDKYFIEGAFRYESSSYFPASSRWGFFPNTSVGWRVSEEKFWKNSPLKFVNNFKVRASYGLMGDDASVTSYNFLTGYNYPANSGSATTLPKGYIFGGNTYLPSSNDKGLANTAITWIDVKTFDVGVDLEAWHGLLGITADYFSRKATGQLAKRNLTLPGLLGADLPQENLNGDLKRGFEVEVSHRNRINDFRYEVRGNVSYTRTKTLHYEQARQGNSYLNWRNNNNDRYNDAWWGYEGNGQVSSWDQIYYSPVYNGRGVMLGDYQYVDWNGDGWINDLDLHPIANAGSVPLMFFGLTIAAEWKGIDLNMLWQGASQRYIANREFLYQPLWASTNAITKFLDRWHPTDPNANPYDPATQWTSGKYAYTGVSPRASSDFNIESAAYLRLKSIELGYSLPSKWLKTINIKSVRVYVNAYNLLTFTKLENQDPEFFVNTDTSKGGAYDLGYHYPLNKTVSVGVNVKF